MNKIRLSDSSINDMDNGYIGTACKEILLNTVSEIEGCDNSEEALKRVEKGANRMRLLFQAFKVKITNASA